jgi:hypothetical protein
MEMEEHCLPIQLGFGVPRVIEAAAHATIKYIADLHLGHGLLKHNFSKAFYTIRREVILDAVRQELP